MLSRSLHSKEAVEIIVGGVCVKSVVRVFTLNNFMHTYLCESNSRILISSLQNITDVEAEFN